MYSWRNSSCFSTHNTHDLARIKIIGMITNIKNTDTMNNANTTHSDSLILLMVYDDTSND